MSAAPELIEFKIALDRVNEWRKANADKVGTIAYRKSTLTHRVLTDLVAASGGTAEGRVMAAAQLKQIEDGTHPDVKNFKGGGNAD